MSGTGAGRGSDPLHAKTARHDGRSRRLHHHRRRNSSVARGHFTSGSHDNPRTSAQGAGLLTGTVMNAPGCRRPRGRRGTAAGKRDAPGAAVPTGRRGRTALRDRQWRRPTDPHHPDAPTVPRSPVHTSRVARPLRPPVCCPTRGPGRRARDSTVPPSPAPDVGVEEVADVIPAGAARKLPLLNSLGIGPHRDSDHPRGLAV